MEPASRLKAHFSKHALFYFVLAVTFAFGLCAHGYRFLNLNYNHDSLLLLQQEDLAWQVGLGRFMQPLYWKLRGALTPPWLLGLLFLLWLGLGNYLSVKLLGLRSLVFTALLCGVLSTNLTTYQAAASYLSWLDIYALAYLLAAGAAYCTVRWRRGWLAALPLLALSLGFYQSYLNVTVILLMIVFVEKALDGCAPKALLLQGLKYVGTLLGGLLCYYLFMELSVRLTGLSYADSSNGAASVLSRGAFIDSWLLYESYVVPLRFMLYPETYLYGGVKLVNLCLGLVSGAALLGTLRAKRLPWQSVLLALLCVVLMPFGINVVFFIAGGNYSSLTQFSYYFFYAFALVLLERAAAAYRPLLAAGRKKLPWGRLLRSGVSLCLALTVLSNVVAANQLYLQKGLEWESSWSYITRICYDIEKTEGYVPGETPVMFLGGLQYSPLHRDRPGFEYLHPSRTEAYIPYIFTYQNTYSFFFRNIYGYNILLKNSDSPEGEALSGSSEVAAMPVYPAAGSCRIVDGVLVVKLS